MTGHVAGSHKKKKKTRLEVTSEERIRKKLRLSEPPVSTTVAPVVTQQTQESSQGATLSNVIGSNSPTPVPISTGSPLADNRAIAEMTTGAPVAIPVSRVGEGYATGQLELFKERTGKKKASKLSEVSVFTHIRQEFIKDPANDLSASLRPPASSSHSVRKAVSSFATITYNRQTKVEPGKSRRLAEKKKSERNATVTPETVRQVDKPVFDIKKASKIAPELNWNELTPTFNLDSHKLCCYVVEDVMYADPQKHERLLLLVSADHIAFRTTWLPIYMAQQSSRIPIMFEKTMFFQIEVEVVKHAK